MAHKDRATVKR